MVFTVVKNKRPRRACGILLLTGTLFVVAPGPTRAHPEVSQQLVNRYLALMLLGERAEIFVTFLYGPIPATAARREMDSDGDGKISPAELGRAQESWRRRSKELASLTVDDQSFSWDQAKVEIQLGADTSTGPAPLVVEVVAARALSRGTRTLRIEPRWEPPALGETELSIELSPDWELVASHEGHGADGQLTRFTNQGPRRSADEDRSATFVVRSGRSRYGASTTIVACVLGAIGLVGVGLELRRRRSGRRRFAR